ncbi:hypothetical protein [Streptomyces aurantiogriseus]|uniref:hypothetical protein n=1 Tax=Streptomyces aurantiogriseus TaxID=66870 RepID=UPI0016755158|nr:hypothetical protein [Streptomyces aurantiogriseus]
MSVPRRERSTTRPASTENKARKPPHLGSPGHHGSRTGSRTGMAGIGSDSVHVTHHAFQPDHPPPG